MAHLWMKYSIPTGPWTSYIEDLPRGVSVPVPGATLKYYDLTSPGLHASAVVVRSWHPTMSIKTVVTGYAAWTRYGDWSQVSHLVASSPDAMSEVLDELKRQNGSTPLVVAGSVPASLRTSLRNAGFEKQQQGWWLNR